MRLSSMSMSSSLRTPRAASLRMRLSAARLNPRRHPSTRETRYPLRTWVRCLLTLSKRPFNRIAALSARSPRRAVVVAAATAAAAVGSAATSDTSVGRLSELSNGPLPETLKMGELIGRGTFGEVYRAVDSVEGEEVAVKIVSKKRQGNDPKAMELVKQRIEHEVSMWCELQSFPSAVHLKKFYEDDDHVYFVQELCNGGSLEDLMKVRSCLSEAEVAQMMQTVLSLAVFCHQRDICYCDIKPANFILPSPAPGLKALQNPHEYVKVIDFGSCERLPKNGLRGEKGTPLYMAPEVHHSRYGVESDIWSAGVLMFYLLSGEMPFIGKPSKSMTPSALSFYIQFGELKFDSTVWNDVTDEAKDLISKMLERNVKKRLTAAEALQHPWMQKLATDAMSVSSKQSATYSDICPMDGSVRVLEQQI